MIKPLGDRVVIEPEAKAEKSAGGIYLPPVEGDGRQDRGAVVAVGPDHKAVVVGDTVLYSAYAGTKVKVEDKDYIILKEEEILAVVDTPPEEEEV